MAAETLEEKETTPVERETKGIYILTVESTTDHDGYMDDGNQGDQRAFRTVAASQNKHQLLKLAEDLKKRIAALRSDRVKQDSVRNAFNEVLVAHGVPELPFDDILPLVFENQYSTEVEDTFEVTKVPLI